MDMSETTTTKGAEMIVTPLHVERGRTMRLLVRDLVAEDGISFEAAVEDLAKFLGIAVESVELGIAIANDADRPSADRLVEVAR
jgi:hypothetical protein